MEKSLTDTVMGCDIVEKAKLGVMAVGGFGVVG